MGFTPEGDWAGTGRVSKDHRNIIIAILDIEADWMGARFPLKTLQIPHGHESGPVRDTVISWFACSLVKHVSCYLPPSW